MSELARVVVRAIEEACALPAGTVTRDGHLVGYGMDSARSVELLVLLEDEHGVVLDDAALADVRTVGDLLDLIARTPGATR